MKHTPVLIAGAGPVGLTLAMDLAWRGIDVTVVEQRHPGEPPNVRCNHTSSRSMEVFRRLGVAETVRAAGLRHDWPCDIAYRTTIVGGIELGRIPIAGVDERGTDRFTADHDWPTAEPPHRISQIYLEPILFAHAAAMDGVTIINRTVLDSFTQDADGVTATLRDVDTGATSTITADWLVGADGSRSVVRKLIGSKMEGAPVNELSMTSCFIRAPQLEAMVGAPAWNFHARNKRQNGSLMSIDGRELWHVRWPLKNQAQVDDPVVRNQAIRDILGVGPEFTWEALADEVWRDSRLVATRFQEGRVFLAGDAAHLWPPSGGYGMNAGIADAADLAWMLAGVIKGWARPALLDAYDIERHPVTEQVSKIARGHTDSTRADRVGSPDGIDEPGPAGDAIRAAHGRKLVEVNTPQYNVIGLNFGYYYEDSPIIAYDGAAHPPYGFGDYTPSTVPGCRTPWLRLDDGRPLFDALGKDFTLLRLDASVDVDPFLAVAGAMAFPLEMLDVRSAEAAGLYDRKLVLVRPDQHVAWRGDVVPDDVGALLDLVRGAG